MSATPNERKRSVPNIVVVSDTTRLQAPGTARVAGSKDSNSGAADSRIAASQTNDMIMRAQLRDPRSSGLFGETHSSNGSPVPLSTPRTIEHFRMLLPGAPATIGSVQLTPPPPSWHESLTDFLARLCSPHRFGLESMAIWYDEVAKIKIPAASTATATTAMPAAAVSSSSASQGAQSAVAAVPAAAGLTRDQWIEAEGYVTYLAQQLAANNPLTGNLHWAMIHYLVQMRCLKTVDFLAPVGPALRNLHFILRLIFKGLYLAVGDDGGRMQRLLADRPIASGTVDLIIDKVGALEDGEIRAYAFKQTLADTSRLHCQLLEHAMLAVARLDVQTSQSAYLFYQDLLAMVLDFFVPQVHARAADYRGNVLVHELMTAVGCSAAFNASSSLAEEAVRALLQIAVDAPQPPSSGHGLVFSAYSYLFWRSSSAQSKGLEQHALLLLLLLVSQPDSSPPEQRNPYMAALEGLDDSPKDPLVSSKSISFSRIFAKIVAEIHSVEWTALLHVLVMRNEAFRTYVLARTDADTLLIPLLKRVSLATAMPLTSSTAAATALASTPLSSSSSSAFASHTPAGSGGAAYGARINEGAAPSNAKAKQSSRRRSQSSSSISSHPSPSMSSLTYPAAGSSGIGASSGSTATTAAASGNTALGARLRQGAMLPYTITADTVPYVQVYLWMGAILSLTGDVQFVEQLRRTTADFWPTASGPMHKQPLSHCVVVETMRMFQLNIMQLKDRHLHDLTLGTLVNVLYSTTGISAAIAQKLVKLYEMIYRRFAKLSSSLQDLSPADHEEHDVYANTLTVLLALFDHLLYTDNAHFIYGLLQANTILGGFREPKAGSQNGEPQNHHPSLLDHAVRLAAKLRVRVAYFHARIAALASPQTEAILELLGSVISSENNQDRPSSISVLCNEPGADDWTSFMLPLVWELLLSSNIATVGYDGSHPMLEEFENMVL
ncbi:hypothetical protein GGI11_005261 [Coemansia sp. RSA 2049]|nr:hypothetical protein GGI11_005261 [Coemansia sp. RSA 2049]